MLRHLFLTSRPPGMSQKRDRLSVRNISASAGDASAAVDFPATAVDVISATAMAQSSSEQSLHGAACWTSWPWW